MTSDRLPTDRRPADRMTRSVLTPTLPGAAVTRGGHGLVKPRAPQEAPGVLMVHNYYQQGGGEDAVFLAEQENLRRHGVRVVTYDVSNDSIRGENPLRTAAHTLWNAGIARELAATVRRERLQVVHFHNTFPLVSPAAYWAVRAQGAAVVQTLHNFRLMCAGATLYREQDGVGRVCEDCLGKRLALDGVRHACYRGSRAGSAVVASMQAAHRFAGTYRRAVDRYIALSETGRDKMIEGGLPADRMSVKPNFLADDPLAGKGTVTAERPERGGYALFVGRLTPEKGILTLLDAWATPGTRIPLKIAGDGPLLDEVRRRAATLPGVEVLGRQDREGVQRLMRHAALLALPSEWYEGFPMTLLEAYACGLPVVASRIGSLASLVTEQTGAHFRPGDAADLARAVQEVLASPERLQAMRVTARHTFLTQYTAERNVQQQLEIYDQALAQRGAWAGRFTGLQAGDARPDLV